MPTINGKACVVNGTPVDKVFSNGRQVYGRNLLANSDQQFIGVGGGNLSEFLEIPFNLNDIFDKYGADRDYTVSFDLSSKDPSKVNSIRSYPNPGTPNPDKYMFNSVEHKNVTTTPKRYSRIIHPTLNDASIKITTLVFYGQYNTGNVPIVNRIKITLGNTDNNVWTPAPEDIK